MQPKIVRVTVEGGVVQDVQVPKGVRVIIHDYDAEGVEPDLLKLDDDGNECIESIWEPEE